MIDINDALLHIGDLHGAAPTVSVPEKFSTDEFARRRPRCLQLADIFADRSYLLVFFNMHLPSVSQSRRYEAVL